MRLPVPHICTAVFRTNASFFCTPTPPQCLRQGSEVQHQAVTTSDPEEVARQQKHFRVCFLFLNLEFLLSPRQLWWVMYCPLTFRVKRFDMFLKKNPGGNLELWLLFFFSVLCNETKTWIRQKVNDTKTRGSKMTFTAEQQSDACKKLKYWLICC